MGTDKKRAILFESFGQLEYFLARVLKAFNFRIYYYHSSGPFRNDNILHDLRKKGIEGVSYDDFPAIDQSKVVRLFESLKNYLHDREFREDPLIQKAMDFFSIKKDQKDLFTICLSWGKAEELLDLAGFLSFREELQKEYRLFLWSRKYYYKNSIYKHFQINNNLYPSALSFLINVGDFLRTCRRKMKTVFTPKGEEVSLVEKPKKGFPEPLSPEQFQTAFFPHKGIWYDVLFLKDQYYSDDPQDPFFKSNILHISGDEDLSLYPRTVEYYRKNNIKNIALPSLCSLDLKKSALSILKFVRLHPAPLFQEVLSGRIGRWDYIFRKIMKVQYYQEGLSKLKNLRLFLVGYDTLFPLELALALRLKNIPTVATQERFLQVFACAGAVAIDHYFISGKKVSDKIWSDHYNFSIGNTYEIGLVRSKLITEQRPDEKYRRIKEKRKLILCLDYHSQMTEDENRLALSTNWKNNLRYYQDLISLAHQFPGLHFTIKGKNTAVSKIPFFRGILEEVKSLSNMNFEFDLETYGPYLMASICDGCIARHTSLGDELLAAGKPVLFYDFTQHIKNTFDYEGSRVVATHLGEVEEFLLSLQGGRHEDFCPKISAIRSDFYSHPPSLSTVSFSEKMLEIFQESTQAQTLGPV